MGEEETNTHAEDANMTQCDNEQIQKTERTVESGRTARTKRRKYVGPACPFSVPNARNKESREKQGDFKQPSAHLSRALRPMNGARVTRNEKADAGARLGETQTYQSCSARRTR